MAYSAANLTHPTSPSKGGAHRANALPPGHLLDEYRIESILGAGGFGVTYKALDTHLESWVAIKEYFPIEWSYRDADGVTVYPNTQGQESSIEGQPADYIWGLERFLDEARVLARIQHPFVVRVKRYFRAHGTAYIVMDYEEGEPLNVVLRDGEVLSEEEIRGLLEDVLPALQAVHEQGYLHRDIKPANLYRRTCDHRIMLIDFGAARAALSRHSKSVTSLVTPGYSPPEQYTTRNDRYGTWTDIYALGAVLYRCITGRTPAEAAERLLDDTLEPAVQVGAGRYSTNLLKVIDRALAVRPEHRFSDVMEMQAALAGPTSEESDETVVMAPLLKPGHEADSAPAAARIKVSRESQAKESDSKRPTARPPQPALEVPAKPAEPVEQHRPAVRRSVIAPPLSSPPSVAAPRRRLLTIAAGIVAVAALAGAGFWLWLSPPKETPPFPHSLVESPQPGSPPAVEQAAPASAASVAAPAPPATVPPVLGTEATPASGTPSPPMTAQSPETPPSAASPALPPAVEQAPPAAEPLSPASTLSAEVSPPSAVPPDTPSAEVSSPTTVQPLSPPPSGAIDDAQTTTAPPPMPPTPAEPAVTPEGEAPVAAGAPPVLPAPAHSGGGLQAGPPKPAAAGAAPGKSPSRAVGSQDTAKRSAAVTRTRSARNRMERRRAPLRSSAALPSAPVQRTYVVPGRKSSNPWDPPASTGFNQK